MTEPIIELENVWFAYNHQPVLEDVRLSVEKQEFLAVIGPNGGGKTTLLKLMLGLLRPARGTVRIFGKPPREMSHRVGYVPQNVHINPQFPITAMDVVLMGKLRRGGRWNRFTPKDRLLAHRALDRLEMGIYCDRRIGEMSGGQRQRVAIARALVSEPDILFLDEPTAGIDTRGQTEFYQLLERLNETITIVVVSHDLMVVSRYVKSIACVNRNLHHHHHAEVTGDMMDAMYPCTVEDVCPVELIAHGLPHRVLGAHCAKKNNGSETTDKSYP